MLSDGMYYIDYVGLATHSQLFWEPCWELFSANKQESATKMTIDWKN